MTGEKSRREFGKLVLGAGAAGLGLASRAASAASTAQADYYVATGGDDSNPGTKSEPFGSVQRAMDELSAGDLAYVRGGTYQMDDLLSASGASGEEGAPIRLEGYPGERPVLRWGGGSSDWEPTGGLRLSDCSHWVVRNLEIADSPYKGINVYGDSGAHDNLVENVEVHHNDLPGVHVSGSAENNVLRNVVTHHNHDRQAGGGNADGIQISGSGATNNRLEGCVAYANSDDGFDFWEASENELVRCRAFDNGRADGNGNGFKLGGGGDSGRQRVVRSVAYRNRAYGFDYNGAERSITLYNNTAWENGDENFRFSGDHVLKNNLSAGGGLSLDGGLTEAANSWGLGIDDPQFRSVDPTSTAFLRLSASSPARNAGESVGLNHVGRAPDLGAFEYRK